MLGIGGRVAVFEQLRISLDRDAPGPILDAAGHTEVFRDRQDFLKAAFSQERFFQKGSRRFEFVPLPIDGDYVAGIFKRARPLAAHDRSLQRYEAENYEGAVFILTVSKPQLAWMQFNPRLGSNKALLDAFFDHLRHTSDIRDWKTYVEYLHDEDEYWSVIEKRRYEIAKITFTFIPPNALSADEKIWDLIKAVHAEAHPDIQQHSYRAPAGQMKPDTEHMSASARIAMAGGGEADVRSADGRLLYNSRAARKITADVPDEQLPTENNPTFVRLVRDWLFDR
jgi:hypothetical protein